MVTAIAVSRVSDQSRPIANFGPAIEDNIKRFDERSFRQAEQHVVSSSAGSGFQKRQRFANWTLIVSFGWRT